MNIKIPFLTLLLAIFSFTFLAFDRNNEPPFGANDKGTLTLEFDHVVGDQDLQLDKGTYTNAAGEQLTINLFQYYISNIKLKTKDGKEYAIPQDSSYFLVREHDVNSQKITLHDIPVGNYTEVSFVIGIDSLRNTMELSQRTGVLDIGNAEAGKSMYWSWNSGYIFVKMEGTSPQAPVGNDGQQKYRYHIGGYGGYNSPTINNIKTKTLTFGKDIAKVRKDKNPSIRIKVDALKVLNGDTNVSIAKNPSVMFGPFSVSIANNYVSMFEYEQVDAN